MSLISLGHHTEGAEEGGFSTTPSSSPALGTVRDTCHQTQTAICFQT